MFVIKHFKTPKTSSRQFKRHAFTKAYAILMSNTGSFHVYVGGGRVSPAPTRKFYFMSNTASKSAI